MYRKIEAIVRPEKVNAVKAALAEVGIRGMNLTEIRGHGRQGGVELSGSGSSFQIDLLPKVQFNIVLSEHNLDPVLEAIREAAYTGEVGDGLVFIYPVEDIFRIRTGERGRDAISYPGDIDEN